MLLLHTADWHLGQTFHEFDRFDEHERFLGWLLDTIDAEQADALLVAGDIFDHANPTATSQRQLYRFLTSARRRRPRLDIVLIAGNHDSPGRLEAPSPLLETLDITVVGQVVRREDGEVDADRLVVPLHARGGKVAAWCVAVPFVRSSDLPASIAEPATSDSEDPAFALSPPSSSPNPQPSVLGPRSHRGEGAKTGSPYTRGVARLYQQAIERVLARRTGRQALVALGHCHVAGGAVTADSERPIVAAVLDAVGADIFDPRLAYVALGHFHRAQAVGGDERVRYAGSPLPLSFSETGYPHQVVRVELDGNRLAGIRSIPVPRFVGLLRVPTVPASPEQVLAEIAALDLPHADEARRPYLDVRVLLDGPEPGLRARIEEALAGRPVRLARIETTHAPAADAPDATAGARPLASLDDLAGLRPDDVFRELHRTRYGCDPPPELLAAFGDLLRESAEEGRR